jgi:hypothetical protein
MTLVVILAVLFLIAVLAPIAGVDSRDLAATELSRDKLSVTRLP